MGHPFAFIADTNTLLPLMNFIEDPSVFVNKHTWIKFFLPAKFRRCACECRWAHLTILPVPDISGTLNIYLERHTAQRLVPRVHFCTPSQEEK